MKNYKWQEITVRDSETGDYVRELDGPLEVLNENDEWVEGFWVEDGGKPSDGWEMWGVIHDPGGPLAGELDVEIYTEK